MNKRIFISWVTIISFAFIPNLITNAQNSSRAGLVVDFGDGSKKSMCISFEGDNLTGIELLGRSGLNLEANYSPLGAAVCKIGDQGCPADDSCLKCQAPLFWSYWQLTEGEWVYSVQGASISEVRDGDVDAWVWGAGNAPEVVTFDEICNQSTAPTNTATTTHTARPSSTSTATNTPQPLITSTSMNTSTPVPSLTASPILTDTPTPYISNSETPSEGYITGTESAALLQENADAAAITPIIVRSIPTEQNQSIPTKANLPPKKAAADVAAHQEITQPTPTPLPENDSMIGSVLSDIFKTVQNLVNVLLP